MIERRLSRLHPEFAPIATRLYNDLTRLYEAGTLKLKYEVFETFRDADRQNAAFAEGTSKARAGQSAHNYGLAVDFVPYVGPRDTTWADKFGVAHKGWVWPDITWEGWGILDTVAKNAGLVRISWDKPHVESPLFQQWKASGDLLKKTSIFRNVK